MSILLKLREDLIVSRKARNEFVSDTLRTLIGDIELSRSRPDPKNPSDDEISISRLNAAIKNAQFTMEKSSDPDIQLCKTNEIAIYRQYLPVLVSVDDIRAAVITKFGSVLKPSDLGLAMKFVKTEFSGNYDGGAVSTMIKSLIV